jgi:hypothetical protein
MTMGCVFFSYKPARHNLMGASFREAKITLLVSLARRPKFQNFGRRLPTKISDFCGTSRN